MTIDINNVIEIVDRQLGTAVQARVMSLAGQEIEVKILPGTLRCAPRPVWVNRFRYRIKKVK